MLRILYRFLQQQFITDHYNSQIVHNWAVLMSCPLRLFGWKYKTRLPVRGGAALTLSPKTMPDEVEKARFVLNNMIQFYTTFSAFSGKSIFIILTVWCLD